MSQRESHIPEIGTAYATGQLVASLRAAASHTDPVLRAKAEARSQSWLSVLTNLASGALKIGQRAPYAGVPTWVTPEVVRGGFASGEHAAGGPLRPHEVDVAEMLGVATRSRTALNGHFLTARGSATLTASLASGTYRIDVPEEGALLAVRWLIERGELESAAALIETIEPFFDRLRFHARSSEEALKEPVVGVEMPVLARSAHALSASLAKKTPSKDVETMREAYDVWAPITDALVSLVLETLEAGVVTLEQEPRRAILEGRLFARTPALFAERRVSLLDRLESARRAHTRCVRVHRDDEVLGALRNALEEWPDVTPRTAGMARLRLAGFVVAHGVPGSERHRAMRATQHVGPSHALIAHVLSARLASVVGPGEGLTSDDAIAVVSPVTSSESSSALRAGTAIPSHLARRVETTEEAPLATHLARGVVRSGEVLATLLPQLTGPALATRFDDVSARVLYVASYRAFRQRRSLLLLWLQHQVRFGELPWIAALEACADRDPRPAVESTLSQLAAFALESFPGTITPNKLVSELSSLAAVARPASDASDARPWLPLVEEVAADIFMGTFSIKFLRAAQIAARFLGSGSLYARYYGLDFDRVLAMENVVEQWSVKTCPDFDAYCLELADLPSGGNPRARAGAMIEQASILTTHNLAALTSVLGLGGHLGDRWAALAEAALVSALDRLERRVLREKVPTIQRMRASKTLAFAWRQMLFFASQLDADALAAFVTKAYAELASRTPLARERFAPVMEGLRVVARGERLGKDTKGARRLLGWSVGRPFLMGT